MTLAISAITSPDPTLLWFASPRMLATLYPKSFVDWSMSMRAWLLFSISRIIAPFLPFNQPTQLLGMRTDSTSCGSTASPNPKAAPAGVPARAPRRVASSVSPGMCKELPRAMAISAALRVWGSVDVACAAKAAEWSGGCSGPRPSRPWSWADIWAAASGLTFDSSAAMSSRACRMPSTVPKIFTVAYPSCGLVWSTSILVALLICRSWTTLPFGPFSQPMYWPSMRSSSLRPGKVGSRTSPDWSMTFAISPMTSPRAVFFCSAEPRRRAVL
mmetsp:Transcript_133799/g.373032  ORF Transcript_133799/g.373032 Transcript_133799/m.373032 type:complete len:272 (-) Transcript_133799:1078-1893(-)